MEYRLDVFSVPTSKAMGANARRQWGEGGRGGAVKERTVRNQSTDETARIKVPARACTAIACEDKSLFLIPCELKTWKKKKSSVLGRAAIEGRLTSPA